MEDNCMKQSLKNTVALGLITAASIGINTAQADDLFGEGVIFEPKLTLGAAYDNNISQAADSQRQDESLIGIVSPSFLFGAENRNTMLSALYTIYDETYEFDTKNNDHTDHHLDLSAEFILNSRNTVGINGGYHKQQDLRTSTNRSDPNEKEGDRYNWKYIGGLYRAGADSSRVQVEVAGELQQRRYNNNLTTASDNQSKERDTDILIGTLYFNAAPKTRFLIELQQRDFDYISSTSLLDNSSSIVYVGVTWEATAKTTGTIRVGQEKRDFDHVNSIDFSESAWDIGVTWQPRDYNTFSVITKKTAEEGSVRSSLIDTTKTTLSWNYEWTPKISSNLSYGITQEKYLGSTFSGREDDTSSANIRLLFKASPGAEISAGYTAKSRDSNSDIEKFDRDILAVNLTFLL